MTSREQKEKPGPKDSPSFNGIDTDMTGKVKSIRAISQERLTQQKKEVEVMEDDLPF